MPVVLLIWVRVSRPSVLARPAARPGRRPEPGGRPTRPRRAGTARRPAAAFRGRPGGRPRRAGVAGWTLRGRPGRRAVLAAARAGFAARAAAGLPRRPAVLAPAGLPGRRFGAAVDLAEPEPAEPVAAAFLRGRPRLPAFSLRSSAKTGSACSG